jgi:uncharacterized protein involved in outer membrane biogenesis
MRRGLSIALLAIAVIASALVAAFVSGAQASGEFLRAPLERALTAAFGVPARIEGPLTLHTGLSATLSADALVLADPSGPPGATLARGIRPSARIGLLALLRRAVTLEEVTGERLELTLLRRADGSPNWAPIFSASPEGAESFVSFGGINGLRIGSVTGSYQTEGAAPLRFTIAAFEGTLPLHAPVTARGTVQAAGSPLAFDLRSASLADLAASLATLPLQGSVTWAGTQMTLDAEVARDGSRMDADVRWSAADAGVPLTALGIAAHQPGKLELRMRLGLGASQAVVRDLAATLGSSAVSGSASLDWSAAGGRITADLASDRIDLGPFLFGRLLPQDKTAATAPFELLERLAAGSPAQLRLAIAELAGLPITLQNLKVDGRSGDGVVGASGDAVIAGVRTTIRLDYDARKPRRTLAARVDSGGASTTGLGPPHPLSGSVAGMRGQLTAAGEDAASMLASLQSDFEARDLRWTLGTRPGPPKRGHFDLLRVVVHDTRASSAELIGKLGDAACSLKVSGGALAPLFEGQPWPLQLAATCAGGRLRANGRITLVQQQLAGELSFDAAADRFDTVAQAIGLPPSLPGPLAARGTLAVDEKFARVRLSTLRLGRSAGAGDIVFPLDTGATPRVQLVLSQLDLDEWQALAGPRQGSAPRPTPRQTPRLPDLDFELKAGRGIIAETHLRRAPLAGTVRAQAMPPAPLRFTWEGLVFSGEFGADFSRAEPQLQLDGSVSNADLRPVLARLGQADVRLRAGLLSIKARATGAQLDDLLASATLGMALERGQIDLPQGTVPALSGRGEFSATLAAAPGQASTLAVRGTLDSEAMDLSLTAPALADIARADAAFALTLKMTLGEAQFSAAGTMTRAAAGEGQVQVSGRRLDRLGTLIGVPLPKAEPYSASAKLVVSADTLRAADIVLSFGRSQVDGEVRLERRRGNRPRLFTGLRVQALHLEDIGADRWLRGNGDSTSGQAPEATTSGRAELLAERGLDLLRTSDIDLTVDIQALHSAGEPFASGRLRGSADARVLRLQLQDVRAAGAGIDADIEVDASIEPPKFGLRAQVQDLEYAPLVRAAYPASTAGGKLDFIVDLNARATPDQLLPALAGSVDAAVYPRGLHSAGLALWGTGLLYGIVGQVDPNSRTAIECAVTSADLGGGVARSTAFFVDSSRVRIVGEFEADLRTGALSGRIDPQSNVPQILTLAPTLLLSGSVDSPQLTVATENLVTVPLRFAVSVPGLALDLLGGKGRARDGLAGCREAFEAVRPTRK